MVVIADSQAPAYTLAQSEGGCHTDVADLTEGRVGPRSAFTVARFVVQTKGGFKGLQR
jgi:hypothetical protein